MRILLLGRGVIATLYARVLHAAGHDVEFLVRPGRAAQLGDQVRLDWIDGRRRPFGRRVRETFPTRLRESLDPADRYDLVVLSVGHHQLPQAAATVAPHVGTATVLVLGNVWDEPAAAVAPIPAEQVVLGFPQAGGGFGAGGVLSGALLPGVVVGTTATPATRREQQVVTVMQQAGLTVRREPDMRGWLWLHVAADAGMFAQALRSGSLAQMVGDRRALRDAFLAARELLPVLEARGVDLRRHRLATLPLRRPSLVAAATAAATVLLPIARRSLEAHTDPHAAEARSVLDDTLREARRLGIPTPRLEQALDAAASAAALPHASARQVRQS